MKNLNGGTVNIIDYFDELVPNSGQRVGFFTFQNGIQNTLVDFEDMGNSIIEKFTLEQPLCIGLYNKTNGIIHGIHYDLQRLVNEWTLNPYSVLFMRQMLTTFADLLPSMQFKPSLGPYSTQRSRINCQRSPQSKHERAITYAKQFH